MRNWIKVERAKKNISQQELANALGVSRYAVVAIETGRYEPSCEFAIKVADYFGKEVKEIRRNEFKGTIQRTQFSVAWCDKGMEPPRYQLWIRPSLVWMITKLFSCSITTSKV